DISAKLQGNKKGSPPVDPRVDSNDSIPEEIGELTDSPAACSTRSHVLCCLPYLLQLRFVAGEDGGLNLFRFRLGCQRSPRVLCHSGDKQE
uniref:Uncharacterized protein n=1 Tax=Anopheles atroparvus TaxID=41427 RepID=A0AAG5DFS1_ANOAO